MLMMLFIVRGRYVTRLSVCNMAVSVYVTRLSVCNTDVRMYVMAVREYVNG